VVITKLQNFFAQPSGKSSPETLPRHKKHQKGAGKAAKFKIKTPTCQYHPDIFEWTWKYDKQRNLLLSKPHFQPHSTAQPKIHDCPTTIDNPPSSKSTRVRPNPGT
jgi:hypothetical protein